MMWFVKYIDKHMVKYKKYGVLLLALSRPFVGGGANVFKVGKVKATFTTDA